MCQNLPLEAYNFAVKAHGDQRYGNGLPYIYHLTCVVQELTNFGFGNDPELIAAGFLHDTVEDSSVTKEQINSLFGPRVTELVWAVTGVGKNRKERNASMYEKVNAFPFALPLKLADRIANVSASLYDVDKMKMYRKEREQFEDAFKNIQGYVEMWDKLEDLFLMS